MECNIRKCHKEAEYKYRGIDYCKEHFYEYLEEEKVEFDNEC